MELDLVNGSFVIYVRFVLGRRYISSLHSAEEPQEGRNSCPLLRSCFIAGSCHVGVMKRFSRSISLAKYQGLSKIRLCKEYVGRKGTNVSGFNFRPKIGLCIFSLTLPWSNNLA